MTQICKIFLKAAAKVAPTVAWLMLLVLLHSCTTEKNTWLVRKFHTTCTHFNGYFWGKLSYQEGIDKLNTTHKDDYSDVLPVYVYAESTEAQSIYPQMDRAIKKCQTMIENHTITDKQKHEIADANRYTKYCYLLMAQANLYKNEYITCIDQLDYTSREYKKTTVKYDAMIWQARAFNQMGAVSKSEDLIDYLKSSTSVPKKLYPQLYAVIADYYERTGDWDNVAKWLDKAVESEPQKPVRARYYFILGQLAMKRGENAKAYEYFTKTLKNKPLPELEFEATIFRAMLFMGGDKENQRVKKELVKMLKPTKYLDYRDQIYYALAKIAAKEGDTDLFIQDLNKSVRASTTNQLQKAISFLTLADYNFDKEEYVRSKKYFDSTLISLPKKFRGRDSIVAKKENLSRLVTYLDIIAFQDSVQRLAHMDRKDLDKYIDDLISNEKKAEADRKKQKEQEARDSANQNNNQPTVAAANGKWYFYNPASLQQGLTEFAQKWGNRPLEDDWRRSHKAVNANNIGQQVAEATATDTSKTKKGKAGRDSLTNKHSRAFYLKDIPLTDAKMKKSVDSLIDAYYNAGAIYKEYLHNYRKSSADFEELLKRFPDNKYKLIVYYELYRIYKDMHNDERMNYYKDLLLTKYPDTQYALLIKDPEKYARNREANRQEMLRLYSATMQAYNSENYVQVLSNCQQADSLFPQSELTPKFDFLRAIATGAAQGLDAYKNALTRITILYPKDSVKFLAQSILDYLNRKPKTIAVQDTTTVVYSQSPDSIYFWVILVDNKESSKISGILAGLTDMNGKTFSQDALQSDEIFLNPTQIAIIMKSFTSLEKVKNYYQYLNGNPDIFRALSSDSYQTFYISRQNSHIMFSHRKADEYLQFFREKLL
ncbi:MAG: tetratricopeptide repeat protein [Bacteroidia bacterium]